MSTWLCNLLQWAVDLQQHQWCRIFKPKADTAAACTQSVSTDRPQTCVTIGHISVMQPTNNNSIDNVTFVGP